MKDLDLFKDECQVLHEETFLDFANRYDGYGNEFYSNLKNKFPLIFNNLKYYKAISSTEKCKGNYPQLLDSYAHFILKEVMFRIYIDPESEVIGIHNFELLFETGYWSNSPIEDLNNFIEKEIIPLLE